ncbi:MAG TPA: hypothetical protein QF353_01370 [Gammaproteobacteria bacterium]|nr:hypothetical protein [Gammaproteobacteria bacterium]
MNLNMSHISNLVKQSAGEFSDYLKDSSKNLMGSAKSMTDGMISSMKNNTSELFASIQKQLASMMSSFKSILSNFITIKLTPSPSAAKDPAAAKMFVKSASKNQKRRNASSAHQRDIIYNGSCGFGS